MDRRGVFAGYRERIDRARDAAGGSDRAKSSRNARGRGRGTPDLTSKTSWSYYNSSGFHQDRDLFSFLYDRMIVYKVLFYKRVTEVDECCYHAIDIVFEKMIRKAVFML